MSRCKNLMMIERGALEFAQDGSHSGPLGRLTVRGHAQPVASRPRGPARLLTGAQRHLAPYLVLARSMR